MPRRNEHAVIGALVGALTAVARASEQPENGKTAEVMGGIVGGWVGGIMPDVIEPATTPHHRDIAHSFVTGVSIALAKLAEWQARCRQRAQLLEVSIQGMPAGPERSHCELDAFAWRFVAGALVGFAAGYISHLVLDGATKRGIPLLTR
jgi:uncharacterized membrane protein YeaQ/YmgE (transglycosylase-associated protein family)